MTLLDLIQDVADLLGIPRPSAVVGSLDAGVRQLLQLANREGRELAARYLWQALTRETTFTTVASESQGALAAIIGAGESLRYVVADTLWDRTSGEPITGPLGAQTWQGLKARTYAAPHYKYRIRDDELLILPAPTAGHTVAFEYVSRAWCTDATGATAQQAFAADTDLVRLDGELMRLGLEWRWLQRKGFEYAESFASYERMVADAMARDGTKPVLDLGGRCADERVPVAIPRLIGA